MGAGGAKVAWFAAAHQGDIAALRDALQAPSATNTNSHTHAKQNTKHKTSTTKKIAGAVHGMLKTATLQSSDSNSSSTSHHKRVLDVNVREEEGGRTALIIAAMAGQTAAVRYLIQRQADVSLADARGLSPLIGAAYYADNRTAALDIAEDLIQHGAVVDARTRAGKTALMMAAIRGDAALAKTLLNAGADLNLQTTVDGWAALMVAAAAKRMTVLKVLLNHHKVNLELRNHAGNTVLMEAAIRGLDPVVTTLLEHGADVNAILHQTEHSHNSSKSPVPARTGRQKQKQDNTPQEQEIHKQVSAVVLAAYKHHVSTVKLLLAAKGAKAGIRHHAVLNIDFQQDNITRNILRKGRSVGSSQKEDNDAGQKAAATAAAASNTASSKAPPATADTQDSPVKNAGAAANATTAASTSTSKDASAPKGVAVAATVMDGGTGLSNMEVEELAGSLAPTRTRASSSIFARRGSVDEVFGRAATAEQASSPLALATKTHSKTAYSGGGSVGGVGSNSSSSSSGKSKAAAGKTGTAPLGAIKPLVLGSAWRKKNKLPAAKTRAKSGKGVASKRRTMHAATLRPGQIKKKAIKDAFWWSGV